MLKSVSQQAVFLKIIGFQLRITQMTGIMLWQGINRDAGLQVGGWRRKTGDLTSFPAYCQELSLRRNSQGNCSFRSYMPQYCHSPIAFSLEDDGENGPSKFSTLALWGHRFGHSGMGKGLLYPFRPAWAQMPSTVCYTSVSTCSSSLALKSFARATAGLQNWQWAFHCRHSPTHKPL